MKLVQFWDIFLNLAQGHRGDIELKCLSRKRGRERSALCSCRLRSQLVSPARPAGRLHPSPLRSCQNTLRCCNRPSSASHSLLLNPFLRPYSNLRLDLRALSRQTWLGMSKKERIHVQGVICHHQWFPQILQISVFVFRTCPFPPDRNDDQA